MATRLNDRARFSSTADTGTRLAVKRKWESPTLNLTGHTPQGANSHSIYSPQGPLRRQGATPPELAPLPPGRPPPPQADHPQPPQRPGGRPDGRGAGRAQRHRLPRGPALPRTGGGGPARRPGGQRHRQAGRALPGRPVPGRPLQPPTARLATADLDPGTAGGDAGPPDRRPHPRRHHEPGAGPDPRPPRPAAADGSLPLAGGREDAAARRDPPAAGDPAARARGGLRGRGGYPPQPQDRPGLDGAWPAEGGADPRPERQAVAGWGGGRKVGRAELSRG